MRTFKPGEIAIGQNFERNVQCNSAEILIIDGPFERPIEHVDVGVYQGIWYLVKFAGGNDEALPVFYLRKKRPPESGDAAARQVMLDSIERAKQLLGASA